MNFNLTLLNDFDGIIKFYNVYSLLNEWFKTLKAFWVSTREYQDSDFFPDQLQTFTERCIGTQRFQI